jgi:hypothetical protein
VGLAMLIDSRWRLVLTIRTRTKNWKWRPSIFDKRNEVVALREGFLDACRYVGIPTRRFDLTNQSEIRSFWKWFEAYAKKGKIDLQTVQKRLRKLCDRIDIEITESPRDRREMIITANYALDAFPIVEELVIAAPKLPELCIRAFKPNRTVYQTYIFEGDEYSLNKVYFAPLTNGFQLAIEIYADLEVFEMNILWALFRDILGEYEYVVGVQYAMIKDLSELPEDLEVQPISALFEMVNDFHHFGIDD